jgi:hypothetical protein
MLSGKRKRGSQLQTSHWKNMTIRLRLFTGRIVLMVDIIVDSHRCAKDQAAVGAAGKHHLGESTFGGVRIFKLQPRHQSIGHNSRQGYCSGLGKRASAAIRDYESGIRNRARFTTSMLQPHPSYEILHNIG